MQNTSRLSLVVSLRGTFPHAALYVRAHSSQASWRQSGQERIFSLRDSKAPHKVGGVWLRHANL
jgi:hypothetical protein